MIRLLERLLHVEPPPEGSVMITAAPKPDHVARIDVLQTRVDSLEARVESLEEEQQDRESKPR